MIVGLGAPNYDLVPARRASGRKNLANGKVTQRALTSNLGLVAPALSAIDLLGQGFSVERKPARASVEIPPVGVGSGVPG